MNRADLSPIAGEFLDIFHTGRLERRCEIPVTSLSHEDAYLVQDLVIQERIGKGERVAGYKVGCTSQAVRAQFGFKEPVCGRLMHPHVHEGDVALKWGDFHRCAIEPEFVLEIGEDLTGDRLDDEYLMGCIASVSAGIEVHHFQYHHGAPTPQELISSNCIHAAVVVGDRKSSPQGANLALEGVGLFVDDQLITSGIGAEIMGGPLESLRWLIEKLKRSGEIVKAGQIVIPGSPVELVSLEPGSVARATITNFGAVTATFH